MSSFITIAHFDLANFISKNENINVVHLYLGQPSSIQQLNTSGSQWMDCAWSTNDLPVKIPWTNKHTYTLVDYHFEELKYTYDLENDGQRACQTTFLEECVMSPWYAVGLREETLPAHRFPCTKDIHAKTKIKRTIYTLSNRLYFYVDEDMEDEKNTMLYFRYQHASNVDIVKQSQDFQRAISSLRFLRPGGNR
jgi:hypothetical protein